MTSGQRSGEDPPAGLTSEQIRFLSQFADNASTGRRFLCGIVHMCVALGTIASAVTAVIVAYNAWRGAH